jgi:hypothetical protein
MSDKEAVMSIFIARRPNGDWSGVLAESKDSAITRFRAMGLASTNVFELPEFLVTLRPDGKGGFEVVRMGKAFAEQISAEV